ncbi:Arf family guanine nucleotide exchange factor SBH1 NDAI_0E04720 [Naumovozyma dairenensis CBS 421]|uniref:Protein transport protein Sec61 subunit beta n=1 Tax=Naumovozyma dairenensis (strain ATCC 10597 / BCRC 20456 / CBS 421 / NBRC 0211 / NRRL Y-12639) TaxID=1071378 RepID=G0WAL6_NAUDC|nr:hypothetical protein NDAI_0E04720 [Naumovozyma dairenensis CBS 421]CCD25289.1 hypothetical protein NDAI_0E04720 [Naumovozyma dairenensis CBS 421]
MATTSTPPGGQRTLQKRKQAPVAAKSKAESASSPSSNPMLKIYSDEATGLKIDPLVVLFLAVGFIFSVVALHIISKITSKLF